MVVKYEIILCAFVGLLYKYITFFNACTWNI